VTLPASRGRAIAVAASARRTSCFTAMINIVDLVRIEGKVDGVSRNGECDGDIGRQRGAMSPFL
jgi:hypothetical protein